VLQALLTVGYERSRGFPPGADSPDASRDLVEQPRELVAGKEAALLDVPRSLPRRCGKHDRGGGVLSEQALGRRRVEYEARRGERGGNRALAKPGLRTRAP